MDQLRGKKRQNTPGKDFINQGADQIAGKKLSDSADQRKASFQNGKIVACICVRAQDEKTEYKIHKENNRKNLSGLVESPDF